MKKRYLLLLSLFSFCLILPGCQTHQKTPKNSTEKPSVESTTEAVNDKNVILGEYRPANLLDTTMASSKEKDSCILSPASVDMFIGLLYGGADEKTKMEMEQYFNSKDFSEKQSKFLQEMKNRDLHIANGIWIQKGLEANKDYQNYLKQYLTRVNMEDFSSPKEAADRINTWVKNNTNQLIDSIIDEKDIQKTKIVLANTLYFNKIWEKPFNKDITSKEPFRTANGEIKVDMMHGSADSYFENDQAVAFRKKYNDDFSFIGILPKDENADSSVSLNIPELLETETSSYDVQIDMPKFQKTLSYDLTDTFLRNGLKGIFHGGLNQMSKDGELVPDEILHKIYIDVNEEGTEAAAVTSGNFKTTSLSQKEIKEISLNRPFFFLIQDNESGETLFIGYINKI